MKSDQNTTPNKPDNTRQIQQTDTGSTTNQADTNEQQTEDIEINHNTIMGVLCYLGLLVLIPYITDRKNSFIKFHIKQGLVLLGLGIAILMVGTFSLLIPYIGALLWPLVVLSNLCILGLAIVGIINVFKNQQKSLPLIGGLAAKINI